jgi:thioredoxin-related protein
MKNCLRHFGLLLLILSCVAGCASTPRPSAPLETADDLSAVGKMSASRQTPVMLVFTQPDCPFCVKAKQEHIEQLHVSRNYGSKVIVREVEAENAKLALRDFDGKPTTHAEFARRYDIKSVPTVIVVDARGKALAEPIVGIVTPDFYDLYLEQAIDAGRVKLRRK